MVLEKLKGLSDEKVMNEYLKEAEEVSFEGDFGEAYDKEWALKDEVKREDIELGEKSKAKEIAKNMLKENMAKALISKLTNLTEEELTALEEE